MAHMKGVDIVYFYPPDGYPRNPSPLDIPSHVWVYPLPQSIEYRGQWFYGTRLKGVAKFIAQTMERHSLKSPLLWLTHPTQEELVPLMTFSSLVYDCSQQYEEEFPEEQASLCRQADLIITASETLKKHLQQHHHNVTLVENGVNYSMIERASFYSVPHNTEKVFGFVGVIDFDLDLSPLLFLAREKPLWQFRIFGPSPKGNRYIKDLKTLSNVVFYGTQPSYLVAEFLCTCHVLLEFSYENRLIQDIQTIRMLEYFASGRPIVRYLPKEEMVSMAGGVYQANNHEDFLQLSNEALAENSEMLQKSRKFFARQNSWTQRGEEIETLFKKTGFL